MGRPRAARLLLLLAAAVLLSGCGPAAIGVVDSERVLNQSVRALSMQKELDEREKAMALELQLQSGRLSPADLQAQRTQFLRELQQKKADLEAQLNKELREAVAAVVREKRLRTVVTVKNPILFALPGRTVDITEDVIAKLR